MIICPCNAEIRKKKESQALCRARINERGQFSVVHMKFQAAVWPQIVIEEQEREET